MPTLIQDFPVKIKPEIKYEDFINFLWKKAVLNKVFNAEIKWDWVEYFEEKQEQEIMELESVKSLYNMF